MQRVANDQLWGSGRLVDAYANRILRPVEADILVRYRETLSGRILELGSGAGRLTGYLAEIAAEVRGIDISPEMVAYSRRRYPGASFAQGDLRDPSVYGSTPWDAIVAPFNVVDVFGDGDRQVLLDRVHAALAPDGLFVMSSHNRAVADRLGDPLRKVGLSPRGWISTAVHLPRRWLNRRRLVGFQKDEPSYAILNDVAHDYAVLHYYITRDAQARQLTEHGFELLECLDLDGSPVAPGATAAHCSELHYVARRRD
jgi:SAM-dependent methyltransferase